MVVFEVRVKVLGGALGSVAEQIRVLESVLGVSEDLAGGSVLVQVEAGNLDELSKGVLEDIRSAEGVVGAEVLLPSEYARRGSGWVGLVMYVVYPVLWLAPTVSSWLGLGWFRFLPVVALPWPIVVFALIVMVVFQVVAVWGNYLRVREGGRGDSEETVVLITQGPYGVVRHPSTLGGLVLVLLLPVVLNGWFGYTVLAVVGQALALLTVAGVQVPKEEEFSRRKWGGAYENYARVVPRLNFVLGLWRSWRRPNRLGALDENSRHGSASADRQQSD